MKFIVGLMMALAAVPEPNLRLSLIIGAPSLIFILAMLCRFAAAQL